MHPTPLRHAVKFLATAALLLAPACGDDTSKDSTDSGPADSWTLSDLAGACPSDQRLGGFEVSQWDSDSPAWSSVTGEIYSAVIPATVRFPQESAGDCQLFQTVNPHCDPSCEAGEVCTHDEQCVAYPELLDVGLVSISGLQQAVEMEPQYGYYYDTSVPYPLYQPGALVSVEAAGGQLDALQLRGLGVSPLGSVTDSWVIQDGQDLELVWSEGSSEARVTVSINIDQHGNSPVTMICDTDDDGSLQVPWALLEELVRYGVSGFASGRIRRQTADSQQLEQGCVDLLVYSQLTQSDIDVEGHTPCSSDLDCPEGQHCDMEINTCIED